MKGVMKKFMRDVLLDKDRIGAINKNKMNSTMQVVEYKGKSDIWVKFIESGNLIHTSWNNFIKGCVKNPFDKKIYNIGYLGEGGYKSSENGKITNKYRTWHGMLRRCYDTNYQEKYPSYKDCTVVEEWHNFQTFAKWHDENYYEIDGETMALDKDILSKGNKIYSPDTCVFVPTCINCLILKNDVKRGNLPLGVYNNKECKGYVARCKIGNNKTKHLGVYESPCKAFEAYRKFKEELIKKVANNYKSVIPLKLYKAMIQYNIEIND